MDNKINPLFFQFLGYSSMLFFDKENLKKIEQHNLFENENLDLSEDNY